MKYYSFFAPITESEVSFIQTHFGEQRPSLVFVNQFLNKWEAKTYLNVIKQQFNDHCDIEMLPFEALSEVPIYPTDGINVTIMTSLGLMAKDARCEVYQYVIDDALAHETFATHHVFDDINETVADYLVKNEMFGIDKQIRLVYNTLSYERFKHTMRVVYRMKQLSAIYEHLEPQYAYFAALFHDYAKEMPMEEQAAYVAQFFPTYTDAPKPAYHGFVAAAELNHLDDELDDDVFEAIAFHTIGIPHWNDLGLALFVADYCEFGRGHQAEWELVWQKAQTSLEAACFIRIEQMKAYLEKSGKELYWTTENMLQWLQEVQ